MQLLNAAIEYFIINNKLQMNGNSVLISTTSVNYRKNVPTSFSKSE